MEETKQAMHWYDACLWWNHSSPNPSRQAVLKLHVDVTKQFVQAWPWTDNCCCSCNFAGGYNLVFGWGRPLDLGWHRVFQKVHGFVVWADGWFWHLLFLRMRRTAQQSSQQRSQSKWLFFFWQPCWTTKYTCFHLLQYVPLPENTDGTVAFRDHDTVSALLHVSQGGESVGKSRKREQHWIHW